LKEIFEKAICKQKSIFDKNKRLYDLISYIKLILFIMFAVSVYLMIARREGAAAVAAAAVLLVAQIAAWVYHAILNARIERSNGIIDVNRRHLDRITGKWTGFSDRGGEFVDAGHSYGSDLDIVGKLSM